MNISLLPLNTQPQTSVHRKTENVSFGKSELFRVNLKEILPDKTERFIPAVFSRLDFDDIADVSLMKLLEKTWKDKCKYFEKISEKFFGRDDYFAYYVLETAAEDAPDKKVKSLMLLVNPDTRRWDDRLSVWYLQSAPDIANNKKSAIRGSGEVMIYCATKLMSLLEPLYSSLEVFSQNNKFYKHIGLDRVRYRLLRQDAFLLPIEKSKAFLKKIEAKYGFSCECNPLQEESSEITRFNNFRDCGGSFYC